MNGTFLLVMCLVPTDLFGVLSMTVGVSATQPGFLQFVYENSSNFCALPTFGVIPAFKAVMASIVDGISGFPIDPLKVMNCV